MLTTTRYFKRIKTDYIIGALSWVEMIRTVSYFRFYLLILKSEV